MIKIFYIGVDIGGTKIAAGLANAGGRLISSLKSSTPQNAKPNQIYNLTAKLIRDLLKAHGITLSAVAGMGVGVPGVVRPNLTDILITPNINLTAYPLARRLKQAFRVPVYLGNDVNLGLLGEQWQGVARGYKNVIGIFPGTGVGGGIIIDGCLVLGSQGAAAELGHMILDLNSTKKSAGLFGTLEALASRRAIERDIKDAVKKGRKTLIKQMLKGNLRVIRSKVILEALRKKDALITEIMEGVCKTLGKACISLRHILNPEMIVLGGGLIESCKDYILPRVRKISDADPFFKNIDSCKIVPSLLGDDAVILGAIALVKQSLKEPMIAQVKEYPDIRIQHGRKIFIDDILYENDIYVRADGKVKTMNGVSSQFKVLSLKSVLNSSILKKVCKKSPNILIMGTRGKKLNLTSDGKAFLKNRKIPHKILPVQAAVRLYQSTQGPKTLLIH